MEKISSQLAALICDPSRTDKVSTGTAASEHGLPQGAPFVEKTLRTASESLDPRNWNRTTGTRELEPKNWNRTTGTKIPGELEPETWRPDADAQTAAQSNT